MTARLLLVVCLLFISGGESSNSSPKRRSPQASSSSSSSGGGHPVDFDCPEEFGYYAHPTDCTQYYVCVFGGALLESCTGGLMYSHELQTCDWPRNVGCAPGTTASQQVQQIQPETRHRQSAPPQRERIIQQQIPKHDLYTEDEQLPAEELDSDRQQRVYRGQPRAIGQVQSDRDALSTHSNAIPVPGRGKVSVVSYGTQEQYTSSNLLKPDGDVLQDKSDHNFLTNVTRRVKRQTQLRSHQESRADGYDSSPISWSSLQPRIIHHRRPQLISPHVFPSPQPAPPPPRQLLSSHAALRPVGMRQRPSYHRRPHEFKFEPSDAKAVIKYSTTPQPPLETVLSTKPSHYSYYNQQMYSTPIEPNHYQHVFSKQSTFRPSFGPPGYQTYQSEKGLQTTQQPQEPASRQPMSYRSQVTKPPTIQPPTVRNPADRKPTSYVYASNSLHKGSGLQLSHEVPTRNKGDDEVGGSHNEDDYDEEEEDEDSQDEEKHVSYERSEETQESVERTNSSENASASKSNESFRPRFPQPPPVFFKEPNSASVSSEDVNPFADPDFDFNKFLDDLREHHMKKTGSDPSTQQYHESASTSKESNDYYYPKESTTKHYSSGEKPNHKYSSETDPHKQSSHNPSSEVSYTPSYNSGESSPKYSTYSTSPKDTSVRNPNYLDPGTTPEDVTSKYYFNTANHPPGKYSSQYNVPLETTPKYYSSQQPDNQYYRPSSPSNQKPSYSFTTSTPPSESSSVEYIDDFGGKRVRNSSGIRPPKPQKVPREPLKLQNIDSETNEDEDYDDEEYYDDDDDDDDEEEEGGEQGDDEEYEDEEYDEPAMPNKDASVSKGKDRSEEELRKIKPISSTPGSDSTEHLMSNTKQTQSIKYIEHTTPKHLAKPSINQLQSGKCFSVKGKVKCLEHTTSTESTTYHNHQHPSSYDDGHYQGATSRPSSPRQPIQYTNNYDKVNYQGATSTPLNIQGNNYDYSETTSGPSSPRQPSQHPSNYDSGDYQGATSKPSGAHKYGRVRMRRPTSLIPPPTTVSSTVPPQRHTDSYASGNSSRQTPMLLSPSYADPNPSTEPVAVFGKKPKQRQNINKSELSEDTDMRDKGHTQRALTRMRASVTPAQQQYVEQQTTQQQPPRAYNQSRYVPSQYDPPLYTYYDDEVDLYKEIGDYAQYNSQNNQYRNQKKPQIEIVQQEPARGSGYSKSKYNSQSDIYQSVTPQEYESYSIQTNDDLPYRPQQTKSATRSEVKESEGSDRRHVSTASPVSEKKGSAVLIEPNTDSTTTTSFTPLPEGPKAERQVSDNPFTSQLGSVANTPSPFRLPEREPEPPVNLLTRGHFIVREPEVVDITPKPNIRNRAEPTQRTISIRVPQAAIDSNKYSNEETKRRPVPIRASDSAEWNGFHVGGELGSNHQEEVSKRPSLRVPDSIKVREEYLRSRDSASSEGARSRGPGRKPQDGRGSSRYQESVYELDEFTETVPSSQTDQGAPSFRVNPEENKFLVEAERNARIQAQLRVVNDDKDDQNAEYRRRKAYEEARVKQIEEAEREAKEQVRQRQLEQARLRQVEEAEKVAKQLAEQKDREEAQKRANEEARRRAIVEAQKKVEGERKAREEAQKRANEEARRRAIVEAQKKVEEERKAREEALRRAREEQEAKEKAEEEEERQRQLLEARRAREEADRKAAREEAQRRAVVEEARRRAAAEEARMKAAYEEEQKRAALDEARRRAAAEEAKVKAAYEEEQKRAALDEARRRAAAEEARMKAEYEEEQRREAILEAKMKAEQEAKAKAAEDARRRRLENKRQLESLSARRRVPAKPQDDTPFRPYDIITERSRQTQRQGGFRIIVDTTEPSAHSPQRTSPFGDARPPKKYLSRNSTLINEPYLNEQSTSFPDSVTPNSPLQTSPVRTYTDNTRKTLDTPIPISKSDQENSEKSVRVRPTSYDTQSTPGLTRGGSRHRGGQSYTSSPNDAEPAPAPNRGTPAAPRVRPTLKPSTTVVEKASQYVDIFRYPPTRPDNVYPTPQVDKTAAKCRKDVCLLPDCSCGGKDIPGELTLEETPQIVLITFDDSVNDLNKGLYEDLFEKGRVNPNGCPISGTFYVSHEWTDYSQVQNLYSNGHEIASHSVSHSFGEQFSQKKWTKEIAGQREILAAYGGVRLEDIRGMRAPFLAVGGNKMFKMLYDSNFTYDSSMPVYENRPPSWPYTMDYKIFHDCMIPPCPTKSYPGVWEVPMVMWQDLNGGRCSMGDACSNPPDAEGVYKMLIKNFERHFTTNRAPFGLYYHAAWFTQPHHKEGFIAFLDTINKMPEVWVVTNWQAIQWVRDPTPINRVNGFAPFGCNNSERPKKCNNPKVCNLWHKSGVRYMRTCQPCPDVYPWTGKSGVKNSRVDNEIINE